MAVAEEMMVVTNFGKYAEETDYKGLANLAALILRLTVVY
jgi:hypothetical protein